MPTSDDDRFTEDQPTAPRPRRRHPEPDDAADEDDRPPRKKGGSKTTWIVLGLGAAFLLLTCCGGAGLLVYAVMSPAVGKVRGAAERANSTNNLKQIGIGFMSYHDVTNRFPPPYLKTKTGQPGLSWRVAILPYIEQNSLYQQFKLDEPWDSPNNIRLLSQMPRTYMLPGQTDPTVTHYQVFVGPGTMFDPAKQRIKITDIQDGTSNTIAAVEAAVPVPWTKPDDLPFPPPGQIASLLKWRGNYALVLMADAAVRPLSNTVTETNLRNAITINDGVAVSLP
jgi:hypothetical protein